MAKQKTQPKILNVSEECVITDRRVKNFLNTEVKSYAQYVIETRAIPSIMDGLRVGARKIIHAGIVGDMRKSSKVKMPSLIGDTMKMEYHHGDAALMNTIVQLSSKHTFAVAPFSVIGQIGTLRVPDTETAPRYLHIKYSPFIDIFKEDNELCTYNFEDGKFVQPKFFLPILPITLLWRTNNPGFGFSFRGFSFDIDDVINATLECVINSGCSGIIGNYIEIKPCVAGINPDNIIFNENKNSWYNVGEYSIHPEIDTLIVNDLPFDISYAKFEDQLHDLKESGYILDFNNRSEKGQIKYIIKFHKGRLKLLSAEKFKFFKNLKLFTKIPKLTLNTWDIDEKSIMNFETPQDLCAAFVKRRLVFYAQRKIRTIQVIEKNIREYSDRAKFIQLVIDDKLVINKRKIEDLKQDLTGYGISHDVLKMTISKFTEEEYMRLLQEIGEFKHELDYITNTDIKTMYINDLIDFKSKYRTILTPSQPLKK